MIQKWAGLSVMLLGLSAMLSGCGGSGGGSGSGGPAPTVTLTAAPAAILGGQGTTLTWTSTNATSVVIDNVGAVQPLSGGSATVSPAQTTTYNITATGNGQQATAAVTVTVSPVNSFDGLAEDPTNLETDVDANGAIGTQQFMEYVNTSYQGYDKVTNARVWPTPQPIGTPWQNTIPQCSGTKIQLDAVINFDRLAKRWVISAKTTVQDHYYYCIAVSNTDDLTSSTFGWYAYFFNLDPVLGRNAQLAVYFPDWPKMGTWPDAYYVTMDLIDLNTFEEVGAVACAFDRQNMLLGNNRPTPATQCFKDTSFLSNGLYLAHSLIPADVDGTTAPPPGRDEFMVSIENPTNDGAATTSSSFNLWDFHVDWTTPANSTFTLASSPTVTAYTPGCYTPTSPALANCIAEPGSGGIGQHVDSVGDRFMPRLAYRNFGSYESFLVSHTIQTGPGQNGTQNGQQTGIRWYELRGSGTPAVYQSGTINPDSSLFRFLPSIAQDKDGNAAVGYSISSAVTDPGIDFSFWSLPDATEPAEVTILNGTAEQVNPPPTGSGQWGTYSSMTVDPVDDCTFWYVNEYWVLPAGQTNSSWVTRIANFKVPTCQ